MAIRTIAPTTLPAVLTAMRKLSGRVLSIVSMSLLPEGKAKVRSDEYTGVPSLTHENRFWMRPRGVVSKKLMGACRMPLVAAWCKLFETL